MFVAGVAFLVFCVLLVEAADLDEAFVLYGDKHFNVSARAAGTDKAKGHEYYKM